MMLHSVHWPVSRTESDAHSESFFRTLGFLVAEALDHEAPLSLPTSTHPIVAAAMAYTRDHLGSVSAGDVARAVGVSGRSLRRQFELLGITWRTYVLQAQVLRAMALLAEPGRSVLDVSVTVGFNSVSAFSRAFAERCGESPSSYRRRVTTAAAGTP
jgi:transcriptional regulator GlxA family with amidase domain